MQLPGELLKDAKKARFRRKKRMKKAAKKRQQKKKSIFPDDVGKAFSPISLMATKKFAGRRQKIGIPYCDFYHWKKERNIINRQSLNRQS